MTHKLKIRAVGSSLGTIFPKAMLERMHLNKGDELFAVETEEGILLTPHDPDFEAAMAAFVVGRKKYRNALRKLAE
ncbi:MAG: hypothetical protein WKG32_11985 [Gemmatimonadaceae bacterium]